MSDTPVSDAPADSTADQELQRYLQDGAELSAAYREASAELPPMHLDARVLGTARQIANQREPIAKPQAPMAPFSRHWAWPVSLAAILVLSVSLVVIVQPEVELSQEDLVPSGQRVVTRQSLSEGSAEALAGSRDQATQQSDGNATKTQRSISDTALSTSRSEQATLSLPAPPLPATPVAVREADEASTPAASVLSRNAQGGSTAASNSAVSDYTAARVGAQQVRAAEQALRAAERRLLERQVVSITAQRKAEAQRILKVQSERRTSRDAVIQQALDTVQKAEATRANQSQSTASEQTEDATPAATNALTDAPTPPRTELREPLRARSRATTREKIATESQAAKRASSLGRRPGATIPPVTERILAPTPTTPVEPQREALSPAGVTKNRRVPTEQRAVPTKSPVASSQTAPVSAARVQSRETTADRSTADRATTSRPVDEAAGTGETASGAAAEPAAAAKETGVRAQQSPNSQASGNEQTYGLSTSRDISLALTVIRDFLEEGNTKAAKQALATLLRRYPDAEVPADIIVALGP
jgi:hypothetical protein